MRSLRSIQSLLKIWGHKLTDAEEKARSDLAKDREDFMKRWFAIAISVGFATALSNMPWLKSKVAPDLDLPIDWDQVKQIARLSIAVIATILSWDGYFKSIKSKPLIDGSRFSIDIFLVFLYLVLLLTSKFGDFWLFIHAIAFFIYCIWDYLSIRIYPREYIRNDPKKEFNPSISDIYIGSVSGSFNVYHGPAVTLIWTIYFWSLPLSYRFILNEAERNQPLTTFVFAAFVLMGLWFYRTDKSKGFSKAKRLSLVLFATLGVLGATLILRVIA